MKFDFVIGNPPYQETRENTSDKPIYNYFMDNAFVVADRVELITPARFLFNAGNTSKEWNEKMLRDEHFKVLKYETNSKKIFPNTDIKGGILISYRNKNCYFGAINTFTSFIELNSILKKVMSIKSDSLMNIIYQPNRFDLNKLYKDYPEIEKNMSSEGKERRLVSSCLKFDCFKDVPDDDSYKIIGVIQNKRVWKYIKKYYLELNHPNLNKYKVIIPGSNGSGALGEVMSTPLVGEPLVGEPLVGYTQTFIGIGNFDDKDEAYNALKYVKTKFCRVMLGILKITQSNKKETWKYVPLQDFTSKSDIDWTKSIKEIDQQLYKKYGLNEEEINFIETRVKEMQ